MAYAPRPYDSFTFSFIVYVPSPGAGLNASRQAGRGGGRHMRIIIIKLSGYINQQVMCVNNH